MERHFSNVAEAIRAGKKEASALVYETVILDLGNVVLDWNVEHILDSLELDCAQRTRLHDELFAHQDWLELDRGTVSENEVVQRVCKRSPLDTETVEKALAAARNSLQPIRESIRMMNEIAASDITLYCLSNMSRENWRHLKHRALFGLFSGIVISGIEGCMKPDDDIFHLILKRYAIEPSSTLFIDDSLPNIETARRLGVDGFHFRRSRDCYAEIRKLLFP